MPGMDGFETARLIKGREKTQEVPIVFITAFSQETNYEESQTPDRSREVGNPGGVLGLLRPG